MYALFSSFFILVYTYKIINGQVSELVLGVECPGADLKRWVESPDFTVGALTGIYRSLKVRDWFTRADVYHR